VGITASPDNISTPNGLQPVADFSDPLARHAYIVRFNPRPLSVVGQQEISASVYPNPATESFRFSLPGTFHPLLLQIHNTLGQLVQQQYIQNDSEVNTSPFAKGLYYLTLSNENVFQTLKIIIE